MPTGIIESLDHEGRGITRQDGKTIFVDGALPGELVEYESFRRKPSYEQAQTLAVLKPSALREQPRCPHFGMCGGCSMQHFAQIGQVAVKQRVLEDDLWHIARLRPEQIYSPIVGDAWGYRHRARFSARLVPGKGAVLVGFRERRSSYIADMSSCAIVPAHVSALLLPLRELIGSLSINDRLPQVEVAVGAQNTVLVFRILHPLSKKDEEALRRFADKHVVVIYVQPGGPDTVTLLHPLDALPLSYRLPEFGLELFFAPTEFTQVNPGINEMLIRRSMRLLAPQPGERVADMFCGLGNFTLPIARLGAKVVGIEGSAALVRRAADNAKANGLSAQTEFAVANLFEATPASLAALGRFDKMLIDPPREGAMELVKSIGDDGPQRIVYVSCNPSTLARDAAVLANQKGYRLAGAGVANMFPQTSHVESIALFER